MERRKGLRKLLSIVLAFCLVAGMIPDAAFAQDGSFVISSEEETMTEVSTEASTDSAQTETEATTETTEIVTEAVTEEATETETETQTETGTEAETETGTEAETETETETETAAALLGSSASTLCDHGNDAGEQVCQVDRGIPEPRKGRGYAA